MTAVTITPNAGFSVQRRNLLHKVICYLLLVMGTKSLVKLVNCLNQVPARSTHLHVLTPAALHVTVLLLLAKLTTACHCSCQLSPQLLLQLGDTS